MKPRQLTTRFPKADQIALSRWGTVSVAVCDTETGDIFHNETARFPLRTASIIKVPLLMAYLAAHNNKLPEGAEKADAEAMIRRSDNDATTRFWQRVGPEKAVGWMQKAAQSKSITLAPENRLWWGYSHASAADFAVLLSGLVDGTLLSPPASDYVLGEMRQVIPAQHWGVPEGSDRPALVSVKNGWYPEDDTKIWRVHSVGVAPVGNAPKRAVVAVLTRYPLAYGMGYGQETCKSVAEAILRAF